MRPVRPDSRFHWPALALVLGALGTAGGLAWSLWRCVRVDLGAVELGYWYEASRIRRGLQVFVDPMVGITDDGPVRIASLQTYTPFFGYLLSRFPERWTTVVGRMASTVAWFGGMIGVVLTSRPGQRRGALLYALSFLPLFFLIRTAAGLTPDPLAAFLANLGLALVLRRRRVTHVAALLMIAAGLLKPNVIGVFLGVLTCDMVRKEGRAYLAWLASGLVGLVALGSLQWISHGIWFSALRMTTQNGFSIYRYLHFVRDYGIFLGAPQLVVALLSYRADRSASLPPYGAWAVTASVAWQFIASGKYGSTTNYWLEPVMAACVAIGHGSRLTLPEWAEWTSPLAPLILLGVSIVPAREATIARDETADARRLARIGEFCENDATRSWFGIDRLELLATGRIATCSFGYAGLGRSGQSGLQPMQRLLNSPTVSCFLHNRDVSIPFVPTDRGSELPLYDYYLRDTILAAYVLVDRQNGIYIYRHR